MSGQGERRADLELRAERLAAGIAARMVRDWRWRWRLAVGIAAVVVMAGALASLLR